MNYPTGFTEKIPLTPAILDEHGQAALGALAKKGFEVVMGIEPADLSRIGRVAGQEAVREFCKKDLTKRVGSVNMAGKWLEDGRGVFQLLGEGNGGYGWTRPEECEELPDSETTFAIRIDSNLGGKGLGPLFSNAIVSGSAALFEAKRVGFESWGSNIAAFKTYRRAGAEVITAREDYRPTQRPAPNEKDGQRRDIRLFWHFGRTFPET
jgi:hypothetical protein